MLLPSDLGSSSSEPRTTSDYAAGRVVGSCPTAAGDGEVPVEVDPVGGDTEPEQVWRCAVRSCSSVEQRA
jgi:hypothetical protein